MSTQRFPTVSNKFASWALAGAAAALGPTAAQATNEITQLNARTCTPYISGGCDAGFSNVPLAHGLNIGGGYAFASGWRGGYALASAVFAPGGGPLLQSGTYENSSIADYSYTFQVQGAPNTLVPLHMYGQVYSTAIHLSDGSGQPVHLVDGHSDSAPTKDWNAVASATLQVVPVRLTPYLPSSGGLSLQTSYQAGPYGDSFCQNCGGSGKVLDQSIWVWSNSDITVHLDANVLLQYNDVDGGGALNIFGDVSTEVDPTFSIDDPAYSAFTIVGVPSGIAPPLAAAVPEPESWAMLLAGFGLVGWTMRGRQRVGPRTTKFPSHE